MSSPHSKLSEVEWVGALRMEETGRWNRKVLSYLDMFYFFFFSFFFPFLAFFLLPPFRYFSFKLLLFIFYFFILLDLLCSARIYSLHSGYTDCCFAIRLLRGHTFTQLHSYAYSFLVCYCHLFIGLPVGLPDWQFNLEEQL